MFQKLAGCLIGLAILTLSSVSLAQGVNTLSGDWHVSRGVFNGETVPDDVLESMSLKVSEGKFTAESGGLSSTGMFAIGGAADQLTVTIDSGADSGRNLNAKWRMESGQLTIAYSTADFPRDFNSTSGSNVLVLYYASGPRPASARSSTASRGNVGPPSGANTTAGSGKGGGAMTLD